MDNYEVTKLITDFSCNFKSEIIPDDTFKVLTISLADWVSVTAIGKNEKVSKIVLKTAEENGGLNESFAVGAKTYLPANVAALVNGTTSHALDYDDTHFDYIGHPSVVVIPATLAVAEKIGASFERFSECCLIGLELTCRIGKWLGRKHYRTGFHITATAGTLGATMALTRLLNLSKDQTINAFGIACSRASGIKSQFGTMGKPYHAGISASSAVESANLAKNNFISFEKAFEGNQGFGQTHHSEFNNSAFDNLGVEFIFENVTHKYHACCHGIHATIEALINIKNQNNIVSENVKKIEILIHTQYLNVCNIQKPRSGLEAKFSYKLVAALIMKNYDTAKINTFSDTICYDSELIKLRDLVEINTSEKISETGAEVKITLQNNIVFSSSYDLKDLRDINEKEKKMKNKTSSLLGEKNSNLLWSSLKVDKILPSKWLETYHE